MRALLLTTAALLLGFVSYAAPQQRLQPSEILASAAESGVKLTAAVRSFSYYEETTIDNISAANTVSGTYYRLSHITFDSHGNRQEKILENKSSLPDDAYIGTTTARNLTRVYQFVITPDTLSQYDFGYIGRERVDEIDTYVFDVSPKAKPAPSDKINERYLKGRVWIDNQDFCVVKAAGEPLPESSPRATSKFESYFQNQGPYWFPAYASADETMRIGKYDVRLRVKVRFTGYKKTATLQ